MVTARGNGVESLLLNVATLIAERRSLPEVFGVFAHQLIAATAFDYASLVLYEPDRRFGRVVASFPRNTHPSPELEVRPADDFRLHVVAQYPAGVHYRPSPELGSASDTMMQGGLKHAWTVPLFVDGVMQGQMTVARVADLEFDNDEIEFLRTAATLLSGAVREHVRAQFAIRERARAEVISALSLLLHSGEPLVDFLDRLPALLRPAIDFHGATLVEFESSDASSCYTVHGDSQANVHLLDGDEDLARFAASLTSPLCQLSRHQVPALLSPGSEPADRESVAVAPLSDSGELVGLFLLCRNELTLLDSVDAGFVELLATLFGQALANRRHLRHQQQELAEQRAIAAIVADTAQEIDPFELTVSFARHLKDVVPDSIVGFGFLVPGDMVEFRIFGDQTVRVPLLEGTAEAARDHWIYDSIPDAYEGADVLRALGVKAFTVTAARVGGTTLGYLVVGTAREGFRFPERLAHQFVVLAQIVGPVLMQARIAQEAERERALLRMVIDSLSDGVILLDESLQVAYENAFALDILSLLAGRAAPGETIREALSATAQEHLRTASRERVRTNGRSPLSLVGGSEGWLDYQFIPLEHHSLRMLVVLRDATEEVNRASQDEEHRQELERAARLAALGGLVGGVAHELNNPLTAIMGFTELLLDSIPPHEPMAEDLRVVHKEAQRARNIVRDLLSFARPTPLERETFSVHAVVEHIRRMRRSAWLRANLAVHFDLAEGGLEIMGNEDRITQVLLNLVTNAEDAVANSAAPRLIVRTRMEDLWAIIEIEDNGHGIPEGLRERIFEPFFTTKRGTGTGLGLSVSHTIVSSHEGRIEIECDGEQQGTVFRVMLPVNTDRPGAIARPSREFDGALNVLVVDDEPNVRRLCQRLVQTLGHRCSVADGPEAAAALAASDEFDIVLCDYRLAGARGDDVLEAFEKVAPVLVPRTVIATGAASDIGVQELSERYGLRVLPKPYGAEELSALFEDYGPLDRAKIGDAA